MKSISILLFFLSWTFHSTGQNTCIKGNCKSGFGSLVIKEVGIYTGYFKDRLMHGSGVLEYRDGRQYMGDWKYGKKAGNGKQHFEDGSYYVGHFSNNLPHGQGTYTFNAKTYYEGQLENGLFEGPGKMYYEDGSHFVGLWKKNKRNGPGTLTLPTGQLVKGEWKDGRYTPSWQSTLDAMDTLRIRDCNLAYCDQGIGRYIYPSGIRFFGAFEAGQPSGLGLVVYPDGNCYKGYWKNDMPNGEGIFRSPAQASFVAYWKNGTEVAKIEHELPSNKGNNSNQHEGSVKIWAVIVGAATYVEMPPLRYTDNDAFQIYAFLKSPEGGAIPDDQLALLIDEKATKHNIVNAIRGLFNRADNNDVILFYFSGHGVQGAFLPVDFDGINNTLEHAELQNLISQSNAKHKIILADACHSGSIFGFAPGPKIDLSAFYKAFDQTAGGLALIMSSREEEISIESPDIQSGVFSHFLIKALKGMADLDKNGIVTIQELFDFSYNEVRAYTENQQSPIIKGNYDPNIPIAMIRNW